MKVVVMLLPLLAAVAADELAWVPDPDVQPVYPSKFVDSYTRPNYQYGYRVNKPSKKLRFSKVEEARDGRTEGSYSVLLPDDRIQTVTYYVEGDSGFQAKVTYSGVARYPAPRYPTGPPPHSYSDDDGGIVGGRPQRPKIIPRPVVPYQGRVKLTSDDDGSKRVPDLPNPGVFTPPEVKVQGSSDDGAPDAFSHSAPPPPWYIRRDDSPFPQSSDDGAPVGFPFPPQRPVPFPPPPGFHGSPKIQPGVFPPRKLDLLTDDGSNQASDVGKKSPRPPPLVVSEPIFYESVQKGD